jgi:DNA mismatch repair protein MutL
MAKIQRLSKALVNKIAAGEVIERPASVVKELVENSVDAGATRVDVSVARGGTELIRVVDNGVGIPAKELMLAVASHATSKISTAEDLFQIGTFGFRGEALASIAEISHFCIRSRVATCDEGSELTVIGGQAGTIELCGCRPGTEIEVKNLFFNTPVRRRFMRTTQTEMGHVSEALTRIALAYPHIHFTLGHHDRALLDLPPVGGCRARIETLFGRELTEALIKVEADDGGVRLHGYVANPTMDRSNNRMQYLFLNGRYIRDRALGHALAEAYRGLLMTGRYAISFLNIEIPADQVDVNVHPTKMEVRFVDGGRIYNQLLGTVRSTFLSTDLTSSARLTQPAFDDATAMIVDDAKPSHEWLARQGRMSLDFSARNAAAAGSATPAFVPFPDPLRGPLATASAQPFPPTRSPDAASALPVARSALTHSDEGAPAMQVYNQYLITETNEGVVVIDQHALHERILYEELREKVLQSELEVQKLLVPEPVQLTSAECAAVLEQEETLAKLGIEIERMGATTLLISAYPAMLSNLPPAEVLRQVAEKLTDPSSSVQRRDLCDELLHMISCKAAIKAGDPLTGEEISALLRQRHLCQDAHHCPHGRPTTLVFSRDELDRRFKRI